MKHTATQLANWRRYEATRQRGRWNMLSVYARRATGLSHTDYRYCREHYTTLRQQALLKLKLASAIAVLLSTVIQEILKERKP